LADASRERRTVRIAGGMTKSYLGELRATDLELRTTRLAGIVDHVPADLTVTVAAGTRLADLASALAKAGQFLPLDAPHAEEATVGGVIAASSNGFWCARYGGVRDLLIGTRTALADGTVVRSGGRVVKNVAGPARSTTRSARSRYAAAASSPEHPTSPTRASCPRARPRARSCGWRSRSPPRPRSHTRPYAPRLSR